MTDERVGNRVTADYFNTVWGAITDQKPLEKLQDRVVFTQLNTRSQVQTDWGFPRLDDGGYADSSQENLAGEIERRNGDHVP